MATRGQRDSDRRVYAAERARRLAEDEVDRLTARVERLEQQLKALGETPLD
jgi:polyhydroxyalkanoate synthesis regulator phasin